MNPLVLIRKAKAKIAKTLLSNRKSQCGYFMILALMIMLLLTLHSTQMARQAFEHATNIQTVTGYEVAAHYAPNNGVFLQQEINKVATQKIKAALQAYTVERSKLIDAATVRNANGTTTINPALIGPTMPSQSVWSINRPVSLLKDIPGKVNQSVDAYKILREIMIPKITNAADLKRFEEKAKFYLKNEYDYTIATTFAGRQVLVTGQSASVAGRPVPSMELYRWVATVIMVTRVSYEQKLPMRFDYDIVALVTTPTPEITMPECQQPTVNHTITPPFDTRVRFFCREVPDGEKYDDKTTNLSGKTQYDCHSTLDLWANAEIDPEKFGPIKRKYLDNGGLEDLMDAVKGKVDPFAFGNGQRNPNTNGLLIVGDNTNPNVGKTTVDCTSFGQSSRDARLTNNAVLIGVSTKLVGVNAAFEIAKLPMR
jgi:hypothetical protein